MLVNTTSLGRPPTVIDGIRLPARTPPLASYKTEVGNMARWIAFDEESTATVAALTEAAVLFQRGDALDAALAANKPATVIIPGGGGGGDVLLLQVRRSSSATRTEPVGYEATGFLGLVDEPIFDDDPQPKKKWWQRLLD